MTLITEDAPQREYPICKVFVRWMVRTGAIRRMMLYDLPAWNVVYQQMQRWLDAQVFESLAHAICVVLWIAEGQKKSPTAAIFGSRTVQFRPESGGRAGYDGANAVKAIKFTYHSLP